MLDSELERRKQAEGPHRKGVRATIVSSKLLGKDIVFSYQVR